MTCARAVATAILLIETVAVVCQFIQTTDSIFPLLYFTVDSALLAVAASITALAWPSWRYLSGLRIASAVGVVLSAIVFAAVIAPATLTGTWIQPQDDQWVRAATILMHGVAPVLVTVWLGVAPAELGFSAHFRYGYLWPATYLTALGVAGAAGWVDVPYPFLQPSRFGLVGVTAVIAALAGLVGAVAVLLYGVGRASPWR